MSGRALHDSWNENDSGGFRMEFSSRPEGFVSVTLWGEDGEVRAFGISEIRALAEASAKALVLAEAVEADQVSRAA